METKQPKTFWILFLVNFLERFSYYTVRSLIIVYMVKVLLFSTKKTGSIYAWYTSAFWIAPLLCGIFADKFFGAKKSVVLGCVLMALGYFCMAFKSVSVFYAALFLIALGSGFFRPAFAVSVGSVYNAGDIRRDSGFTLLIIATSLGAFLAPLIGGFVNDVMGFYASFALAGFIAIAGFFIYLKSSRNLGLQVLHTKTAESLQNTTNGRSRKNLYPIFILMFFAFLFMLAYYLPANGFALFGSENTQFSGFGSDISPGIYITTVINIFVLILIPVLAQVWILLALKNKNPSTPAKFAIGFGLLLIGFLIIISAGFLAKTAKISVLWVVSAYLFYCISELFVSPIMLSAITRISPHRKACTFIGLWTFLFSMAAFAAGFLASDYDILAPYKVFILPTLLGFASLAILVIFVKKIKLRMSKVG
jgi:POT family proton-dependent oligopeptide transporter